MLMVLLQNSTKRGEKSLNLGLIVFIGLEIITGWGGELWNLVWNLQVAF